MKLIPGVDLTRAIKDADTAYAKIAQARVTDYLRGLKVQAHNLRMKEIRLEKERDMAGASAAEVEARIALLESGDWSAVEPFDLSDGKGAEQKSEAK